MASQNFCQTFILEDLKILFVRKQNIGLHPEENLSPNGYTTANCDQATKKGSRQVSLSKMDSAEDSS